MSKILIKAVKPKSIAEEVGIEKGDLLISINGIGIHDIVEYKYLITNEELMLEIEKKDNEIWEIEIEKEFDEDLGIIFDNSIIDRMKRCHNKCIFCFIDQLPRGLRETLYFKDDDTRLSFLQGNYVTLTNMDEDEIQRIIKYRMSPINISVHTTNPKLRQMMLRNKRAGNIMDIIARFAEARLTMNAQVVLCPDVNDKDELDRTISDLSEYFPWVKTLTVVPVGITRYREDLYPMREFNKREAQHILEQVNRFQKTMLLKHNTRFVFPADELIIRAGKDFPNSDYYEGFGQLENGVGMVTLFSDQFISTLNKIKTCGNTKNLTISVITGNLAYPFIVGLMDIVMEKWDRIKVKTYAITNDFFGKKITVSGLITGQDILKQLKDVDLGNMILIPRSMLKAEEDYFLDDFTVNDLSSALGTPIFPIEVDGNVFGHFFESILS